jgi:F-type H+-transporting ATPase subunit b
MKKLATTIALTVVLFLAAYAAGFFTIGRAMAQPSPEAEHETEAGAPSPIDEHVASPTQPDPHAASHHHDPSEDFRFIGPPFGHNGKDVSGGKLGDGYIVDKHGNAVPGEEEPMSPPFIYMVLNFVLLLIILIKWGAPPARKASQDRHDQIKTALDEAAKLREQAQNKLSELEAKLKSTDDEIKKMVEGMRADAAADKARILENAERQAAAMKKEAEARIAAEIEMARTQLTREVTIAATKATEELLRKKMVPGDQQKLVSTFISDLGGRS